MENINQLTHKLERANRRQLFLIAGCTYCLLAFAGFIVLSVFLKAYLAGLVEGQSYAIAVQEWRGVVNGVASGWSLFPPLKGVCIVSSVETLFSQGSCPENSSLASALLGGVASVQKAGYFVRISLVFSLWVWSLVFPFFVLVPAIFFYSIFRRPLTFHAQLEVLNLIKTADESLKEKSAGQNVIQQQAQEILELRKRAVLSQMAAQVSHDIRSPLALLTAILHQTQELNDESRAHIRVAVSRIRDITHHLLERTQGEASSYGRLNSALQASAIISQEERRPLLLSAAVESIVSQKRIQFMERRDVLITAELGEAYGVFIQGQSIELFRVLSNLMNNAIEALPSFGDVTVTVVQKDAHAVVLIKDTGIGISAELLPRLGQRGETHGKVGGSGLGLYHAEMTLKSWGGKLSINSTLGIGTTVELQFQTCAPPSWFVPEVVVDSQYQVVVLDDDPSIANLWRSRFAAHEFGLPLLHFQTSSELIDWYRQNLSTLTNVLFLCDFELLGSPKTGLEVIEFLGIARESILVTGRADEGALQDRCTALGVRLIPKESLSLVPIRMKG